MISRLQLRVINMFFRLDVALTIIPTTVMNGKVLFAIFAIGIMFLCRFHTAIQYSVRNRCPSFLFFAAEASLVPSDIMQLTKTCCVH